MRSGSTEILFFQRRWGLTGSFRSRGLGGCVEETAVDPSGRLGVPGPGTAAGAGFCPEEAELAERVKRGAAFTRPELAVVHAHGKPLSIYKSYAAEQPTSVDPCGRRTLKKKQKQHNNDTDDALLNQDLSPQRIPYRPTQYA